MKIFWAKTKNACFWDCILVSCIFSDSQYHTVFRYSGVYPHLTPDILHNAVSEIPEDIITGPEITPIPEVPLRYLPEDYGDGGG